MLLLAPGELVAAARVGVGEEEPVPGPQRLELPPDEAAEGRAHLARLHLLQQTPGEDLQLVVSLLQLSTKFRKSFHNSRKIKRRPLALVGENLREMSKTALIPAPPRTDGPVCSQCSVFARLVVSAARIPLCRLGRGRGRGRDLAGCYGQQGRGLR